MTEIEMIEIETTEIEVIEIEMTEIEMIVVEEAEDEIFHCIYIKISSPNQKICFG